MKILKINFNPYIIFSEQLTKDITSFKIEKASDKYKILFLGPEDMKTIAALPGRKPKEEELLKRLRENKVCIALKLGKEIAAFTWYDLKECNIKGVKCRLMNNEAYLFDAYTVPTYRGQGLAPLMRYRSYQELNKLDKHWLLSFSDYYNIPAIRFKEKIKAKPLELRLALSFRGIHLDLRLKRYTQSIFKFRHFYLRIGVKGIRVIDSF